MHQEKPQQQSLVMLWEILICKVDGEVQTLLNAAALINSSLALCKHHWQVKILLHQIVLQKGTSHAHVISYSNSRHCGKASLGLLEKDDQCYSLHLSVFLMFNIKG